MITTARDVGQTTAPSPSSSSRCCGMRAISVTKPATNATIASISRICGAVRQAITAISRNSGPPSAPAQASRLIRSPRGSGGGSGGT